MAVDQQKVEAAKLLRENHLRHFTVRRVAVEGPRQCVGLTLTTTLEQEDRRHVTALACLTDGELTELHVNVGRPT